MTQQFGSQLPDEYDNPPPNGVRVYTPDEPEPLPFDNRIFEFIDAAERAAQNLLALADPARARAAELFGPLTSHPMPSQRAPLAPD